MNKIETTYRLKLHRCQTVLVQTLRNKTLPSSTNKMDKVNDIDMDFIYKKRSHSPETKRLWVQRNHILKPDKTRIVEKAKKAKEFRNIDHPRSAANGLPI